MNKDTLICCIEFYQFSTDRMRLRSRNAHRRTEKNCICRCPRAHFSNTYGAKRGFLGRGRRYMHGPSGEGECTVGTEGRVYKGTEGTLGIQNTAATVALRARWPDLEATAHAADPSLARKSSIFH